MVYLLCTLLLMVGLFGLISQRNLIKIILSIAIIEYAVNLFFVLAGYRDDGIAPIMTERTEQLPESVRFAGRAVDPLPQAMVLTSIVIGLAFTALMVTMALRIYNVYGTYDIREIWEKRDKKRK